MARTDSLPNFLTDVANAIRSKTGETGEITASEFDTKINTIETNTAESVINGIVEQYKVASGDNVNAGDFVKYLNDVNSSGNITNTNIVQNVSNCYAIDAELLTSDTIFIVFGNGTSLYGIVIQITTSGVSLGTVTKMWTNNVASANTINQIALVKLTSTKVFIAHTNSSNYSLSGEVCTISGKEITVGTNTVLDNTYHAGYKIAGIALSSSSVFIAHNYQASEDYPYLRGMLLSISGTTITVNKNIQVGGKYKTATAIALCKITQNGVDRIVVFHTLSKTGTSSENWLYGIVVTPNGTTFTTGTDTQLNASLGGASMSCVNIDNSRLFIGFVQSSILNGFICTVSGTTITLNTHTELSTNTITSNNSIKLDDNHIAIIHNGESNLLYTMILEIDSDNSIITKIDNLMNTQNDAVTKKQGDIISLNDGKILIFNTYIEASKIHLTKYYDYFAQLVSKVQSTDDIIYGVATTSGTEGQMVSVVKPNVT